MQGEIGKLKTNARGEGVGWVLCCLCSFCLFYERCPHKGKGNGSNQHRLMVTKKCVRQHCGVLDINEGLSTGVAPVRTGCV